MLIRNHVSIRINSYFFSWLNSRMPMYALQMESIETRNGKTEPVSVKHFRPELHNTLCSHSLAPSHTRCGPLSLSLSFSTSIVRFCVNFELLQTEHTIKREGRKKCKRESVQHRTDFVDVSWDFMPR